MTRDTAEKAIRALVVAAGEVNDNLFVVQPEMSDAMYEEYKKRSAEVMAAIYLDLMKPILAFHPDLDPGRERSGSSDRGEE